jgi:hypothetical protein
VNQGENAILEMIKEGFHVWEKSFFTDETLNFSKLLLGWASHWWSIATVLRVTKSYIDIISPVTLFMNPSFFKEGLG